MSRASGAGHRLAAGTGRLLYGIGDLFDAPTLRGLLGRIVAITAGLLFAGGLLARVPGLVYAIPVVWAAAAWRVSDSSATPPPEGVTPSGDVYAGERVEVARVVHSPEGVMCTLHPVREEVTER
ncbi:hypothetical protein [Streptomyces pristinaespiralis]|uniref:hypothetical protein n=1 Tax=Streptomyces pristinaespiralis TaxID=38300 RepID=UPI0033F109D2